jgi:type VI secretion system protein VasJ
MLDITAPSPRPGFEEPSLPADDPLLLDPPAGAPVDEDAVLNEVEAIEQACQDAAAGDLPEDGWAGIAARCEHVLRPAARDLRVAGVLVAAEALAGAFPRIPRAAAAYRATVAGAWESISPEAEERIGFVRVLVEPLARGLDANLSAAVAEAEPLLRAAGHLSAAADIVAAAPDAHPNHAAMLRRIATILAAAARGEAPTAVIAAAEEAAAADAPEAEAAPADPLAAELAAEPQILADPPPGAATVPENRRDAVAWLHLDDMVRDWRQHSAPDFWPSVAELAREVLMAGDKDLRAAGLWLVAAWRMRDAPGLRRAAAAVRVLSERFWGVMPVPPDKRRWGYGDFLEGVLSEIATEARLGEKGAFAKADFRGDAAAAGTHLAAAAALKLADGAAVTAALRRIATALADAVARLEPPASPPESAQDVAAAAAATPPTAAETKSDPPPKPEPEQSPTAKTNDNTRDGGTATDAPLSHAQMAAAMRRYALAQFMTPDGWKEAPTDWRPYVLLRLAALWNTDAVTREEGGQAVPISFAEPQAEDQERLAALGRIDPATQAATLRKTVSSAELAAARTPLWLDHHRAVAEALARLGPDYDQVRAAVTASTALLVRRLPAARQLVLQDGGPGCPAADAATQAWLDGEVLGGDDAVPGAEEASALAAKGQLAQAVALLAARRAGAGAGRLRFRLGMESARLLLGHGQAGAALALLEELAREAAAAGLDAWEPELVAALLRLLLRALAEAEAPLRQALRSDDPWERLRAEGEARAREATAREARRRLGAIDTTSLVATPAGAAAAAS